MRSSELLTIQKCLYCDDYAVTRVGIDVDVREDGNIKSGYIYLCQKHLKYIDSLQNIRMRTCYMSCLRELR